MPPTIFVLFGATGDLARRMVLPAFAALAVNDLMPEQWVLIGNGRKDEDDAWYPSDLAGLAARGEDGRDLGEVLEVRAMPAHDVLVLREPSGARTLVPFVRSIVPVVDVAGGFVVLAPPGGLLADEPLEDDDELTDENGHDEHGQAPA